MSKKVLIMSASTGGGHNRAAKAMKEEIEKRKEAEMISKMRKSGLSEEQIKAILNS